MHLSTIDIAVIVAYAVFIFVLAQWVSREKAGHQKNSQDYFLASRALPWWAIGTSLIAANISAEQIIGMSGSGYAIGLAIASYEWMAALTLLIVGNFFLPIFLKNQIYTMPEFLARRYGPNIQFVMAIFWLVLYVFVNLTSILWLGATAVHTVTGLTQEQSLMVLAAFAGAYALYGGLKAIALTDIVQVTMLVLGGLVIVFIALTKVSGDMSLLGAFHGFGVLVNKLPDHFHMILGPDSPYYKDLPGLSVIFGGMWVANLSYWGFNQYIIQRGLAAKSIQEAQKGIVLAAFLKLLIPVLVVVPGIAAVVLAPGLKNDQAYPTLMTYLPPGLLGLVFVALIAAIIASMGSKINSIATIFTMDVYRTFHKQASEKNLVIVGRLTAVIGLVIALIVAKPLIGGFDQAFQYIQEFSGFFTPGITVIFLLGLFWKRATEAGALTAAIGSVVLSCLYYFAGWLSLHVFAGNAALAAPLAVMGSIPFMNRMGYIFLICFGLAVVASLLQKPRPENVTVDVTDVDFSTSKSFKIASGAIIAILVALYATWW
ncbi:MAG: sodium/sugar symporter [Alphaproteobacteria bacterium]|nr:sodium/sugar symporter [Alphaproteobacteria bacterium]MDE2265601.1 sodium/sugar symporter [Alphaproteobacteria bacterium]